MAAADYRLCDVCGSKTFYDANLNYDQGPDVEGSVRNSGVMLQHTRLDYLGDWCVICQECAKTHECQVAQKDAHATASKDAEIEALRAEVERLNRLLGRIVEGDGDSTLTIRASPDAFAAAREYLSAPKPTEQENKA